MCWPIFRVPKSLNMRTQDRRVDMVLSGVIATLLLQLRGCSDSIMDSEHPRTAWITHAFPWIDL